MPNNQYSLEQRIFIISQCFHRSDNEVKEEFQARFPGQEPPNRSTISRLRDKFQKTGCVNSLHDKVKQPRKSLSEEQQTLICASVATDATTTSSTIAANVGVSKKSVLKVLKAQKFRAYKFERHHQLIPADPERRTQFCGIMQQLIQDNPTFLHRICFTDESTIVLVSCPNRQNNRYWAQEAPQECFTVKTQYQEKLNVRAGMIAGRIIGPFFIDGNLSGAKYCEMLQNQIIPAIRQVEQELQVNKNVKSC